ncbi:hypothetical protein M758_1G167500 [Ceratodon purpureus]|nr:hypothetical protein M758_1G166900 [Ceratodon purpureus]KAG0630284.1 hypothetical protein M758_1G167500 [Ceratodon purpureus]
MIRIRSFSAGEFDNHQLKNGKNISVVLEVMCADYATRPTHTNHSCDFLEFVFQECEMSGSGSRFTTRRRESRINSSEAICNWISVPQSRDIRVYVCSYKEICDF